MLGDLVEFFNLYRATTQHLVALFLAGAIWRWGGGPERWLIGTFLATMVIPIYVIQWLSLGSFEVATYWSLAFVVDVIAASLFTAIALQANRNYPLWIAGFQLVALGGHMAETLLDGISPLALAILVIGPSYCQLFAMLVGFGRHRQRERRFGAYRDWRPSAPGLRSLRA